MSTEVELTIVDMPDKVALKNGIGHDVALDDIDYGDESTEQERETFKGAFEIVKNGSDSWFHTDGDLYQGSTLMRVIRRKADGKLFGFSFWQGGGKYGEMDIEHNGDDHGFESKYDWEDGVDENQLWYVFLPVKSQPIPAYVFETEPSK